MHCNVCTFKHTSCLFTDHPLEELPINITSHESYIKANITLDKVYPIPECNFTDGVSSVNDKYIMVVSV